MFFNPGDLIFDGKYRVEMLLDDGGFADVYLVEHLHLRQKRALKILRQSGLSEAERREYHRRFKFESQLGARYDSSFIVKVHDFIDQDGKLALVMAYAPGGSLADKLKRDGKLPIPDALRITLEIAQGLAVLHNDNIIHRDLKPQNVLFDANGRALVADLGLALNASAPSQHRSQLEIKHPGTLNYMSPEQYAGQPLTFASDIYALGCILFEMLTGKVYNLQPGTRLKHLRTDSPGWLDTLLYRMLSKAAEQRPQSLTELQNILNSNSSGAISVQRLFWALPIFFLLSAALWFTLRVLPQQNNLGQIPTPFNTQIILQTPTKTTPTPTIAIRTNPTQTPKEILFTPTIANLQAPTNQILSATDTPEVTALPGSSLLTENKIEMVYIPQGEFIMGSDKSSFPDEQPEHKVFVDDFWIDKTEVTNGMFAQFVSATDYVTELEKQGIVWLYTNGSWQNEPGVGWRTPLGTGSSVENRDNEPVVQVTWNDAAAYCDWLGKRLPTEAEWEKAARGTDGRDYPWGNQTPTTAFANYNSNTLHSVDEYPQGASFYGVLNMAGNVSGRLQSQSKTKLRAKRGFASQRLALLGMDNLVSKMLASCKMVRAIPNSIEKHTPAPGRCKV